MFYSSAHLTFLDLIMITKHEGLYYALFAMLLLVAPCQVYNPLWHPFWYTLCVCLLIYETKFHFAKKEAKLRFNPYPANVENKVSS